MITEIDKRCTVKRLASVSLFFCSSFAFGAGLPEVLHCEMIKNLCYVKASFNQLTDLSLVLDTGSSYSVLDSSKTDLLGLQPIASGTAGGPGSGGNAGYKLFQGISISVGNIVLADQLLLTLPFEYVGKGTGHATDGTLGSNIFMSYTVKIDYQRGIVILTPPPALNVDQSPAIPIEFEGNVPVVQLEVTLRNGQKLSGKFLVDTGQQISGILFSKPFQDAHPDLLIVTDPKPSDPSEAVGGSFEYLKASIPNVQIGIQSARDVSAVFLKKATGVYANQSIAGAIGPDLLEQFIVTFDYTGHRMTLEKRDP